MCQFRDGTDDSSHMALITAAADKIVTIDARLFLPIERHIFQMEKKEKRKKKTPNAMMK